MYFGFYCSVLLSCCSTVPAAAVLLLAAAGRHRVPEGKICSWFMQSDLSVFFHFVQMRFLFGITLGSTLSNLRPRLAYILVNYGHARSQGGR